MISNLGLFALAISGGFLFLVNCWVLVSGEIVLEGFSYMVK